MTDEKPEDAHRPPRRYRWRYGPLRLVLPWVTIGVGILMAVRGLTGSGPSQAPLDGPLGIGLIVLGIAAFFLYRWMAKRGI